MMNKPLIFVTYGTRPEAIKLAPLILRLKRDSNFDIRVVSTGQHIDLLQKVHEAFGFEPDIDLAVYSANQGLNGLSSKVLEKLGKVLESDRPDFQIVQGDTSSAFVGALAAFNLGIPVGHVEAGLRSADLSEPFPEEGNRKMISAISTLHFTPTEIASANLVKENISEETIFQVGNTVIDALLDQVSLIGKTVGSDLEKKRILVTAHRRENWGKPMEDIAEAIKLLAKKYPALEFNVVLHANPEVQRVFLSRLKGLEQVNLLQPLGYRELVELMSKSWLALTDSGGIQEEAPSLGIPVLVLRNVTERPEGVASGNAILVGTSTSRVFSEVEHLITDRDKYSRMSLAANPYGDGLSSERIVEVLKMNFDMPSKFEEFSGTHR